MGPLPIFFSAADYRSACFPHRNPTTGHNCSATITRVHRTQVVAVGHTTDRVNSRPRLMTLSSHTKPRAKAGIARYLDTVHTAASSHGRCVQWDVMKDSCDTHRVQGMQRRSILLVRRHKLTMQTCLVGSVYSTHGSDAWTRFLRGLRGDNLADNMDRDVQSRAPSTLLFGSAIGPAIPLEESVVAVLNGGQLGPLFFSTPPVFRVCPVAK